jgi:hypothetical protein
MGQRLVAQPGLNFGPRLDLALGEEAVKGIAKPHVEAGVIEARDLEIDLAVVEALEDAHGCELFILRQLFANAAIAASRVGS